MAQPEEGSEVGRVKGGRKPGIDQSETLLRLTAASHFFAKEEAGRAFLEGYGISFATAKHFGVGLELIGEVPFLTFPLFDENGVVLDVHFLNTQTKKWDRMDPRVADPLFHQNRVLYRRRMQKDGEEWHLTPQAPAAEVFVCSGVLDTMSLYELGFENVVGLPATRAVLSDHWVEALRQVEKSIYFVVGKEAMKKTTERQLWERARQVGIGKASFITLPTNTMNELLLGEDGAVHAATKEVCRAAFELLVKDAVKVNVADVKSYHEIYLEYREKMAFGDKEDDQEEVLFDWDFDNLRTILGTPKPGNYLIVVSEPKVGKTGLLASVCARNGLAGRRGLFYCLEEKRTEIFERMVQSSIGVTLEDVKSARILTEVGILHEHMEVYFCEHEPQASGVIEAARAIIEKMRDSIQRYALRWVVFDNIHWLIRNSRNPEMDTSTISREFKRLAKQEQVVVVVLAHPRKMEEGKQARARDMKYSGALAGDCDGMLFINRAEAADPGEILNEGGVSAGARSPLAEFYAEGRKAPGGRAVLMYEGLYSRFRRLTKDEMEDLKNAWERRKRGSSRRKYG